MIVVTVVDNEDVLLLILPKGEETKKQVRFGGKFGRSDKEVVAVLATLKRPNQQQGIVHKRSRVARNCSRWTPQVFLVLLLRVNGCWQRDNKLVVAENFMQNTVMIDKQ